MCWYQKKMGIAADGQLRSSSLPPTSHVSPLSLLFGELNKLPTFFSGVAALLFWRIKVWHLSLCGAIGARIRGGEVHLLG